MRKTEKTVPMKNAQETYPQRFSVTYHANSGVHIIIIGRVGLRMILIMIDANAAQSLIFQQTHPIPPGKFPNGTAQAVKTQPVVVIFNNISGTFTAECNAAHRQRFRTGKQIFVFHHRPQSKAK
ncbi:hypothetical protein SDC9_98797 [bioreactor metagenome]|uniref:Uncharacterized protein n=1 Tax=bioreactor metagenome TaxID=1076179 RepID=A0A645AR18_9ZZZZ